MELGALICTPTLIKCNECPLNQKCMSYEHHTQMFYPIKTKNKKSPEFSYKTLLIVKNHQILMSNDDLDGLMKGFYRLPQYDIFDTKGYNYFEKENTFIRIKLGIWKYIFGMMAYFLMILTYYGLI